MRDVVAWLLVDGLRWLDRERPYPRLRRFVAAWRAGWRIGNGTAWREAQADQDHVGRLVAERRRRRGRPRRFVSTIRIH